MAPGGTPFWQPLDNPRGSSRRTQASRKGTQRDATEEEIYRVGPKDRVPSFKHGKLFLELMGQNDFINMFIHSGTNC